MAYQLDLNRLSNLDIKPCFTDNRQIHVYYAIGKENTSDCRVFIRALVRSGDYQFHADNIDRLWNNSSFQQISNPVIDQIELLTSL